MIFDELRVRNLRCVRDSGQLPLRQINLVVGGNGSGKSSILAGILLLKQTCESADKRRDLVVSGPLVDLGSDWHAAELQLSVAFAQGALPAENMLRCVDAEPSPACTYDALEVAFRYEPKGNHLGLDRFRLTDRALRASVSGVNASGTWYVSGVPNTIASYVRPRFLGFVPSLAVGPIRPPDERAAVSVMDFCLRSMLRARGVAEVFESVIYLPPHEIGIRRYIGGPIALREALAEERERIAGWSGHVDGDRRALEASVARLTPWLDRIGIATNVRLESESRRSGIHMIVADDRHGRRAMNIADLGRGIGRFASIVLTTLTAPSRACMIIEHPETHLDDLLQDALADFFTEQLGSGRQFIIETHGARFVERMREKATDDKLAREIQILSLERAEGWTKVSGSHTEGEVGRSRHAEAVSNKSRPPHARVGNVAHKTSLRRTHT